MERKIVDKSSLKRGWIYLWKPLGNYNDKYLMRSDEIGSPDVSCDCFAILKEGKIIAFHNHGGECPGEYFYEPTFEEARHFKLCIEAGGFVEYHPVSINNSYSVF